VRTRTHRHRRKTGSGPPANALIAWVGTDPYLRDAVTTASHRRELAPPLPSRSRSATAALTVCIVLVCGATVGITEVISHGRAGQHTTPPIAGRDTAVAHRDHPNASGSETLALLPELLPDGASPPPGSYRTPAAMKPMLVEGQVLPSRSEPAPAPPSATASVPSSPGSSVALPGITEAGNRSGGDSEPAGARVQTGHGGDAHPHDGQLDTPAAERRSGKATRSVSPIDASNAPGPAAPRGRPAPRGTGTSTELPQGTTADGAGPPGSSQLPSSNRSQQSSSDRRPVTSLGSDSHRGSPSRSTVGNRTSWVSKQP
jgi:hypothetical protein